MRCILAAVNRYATQKTPCSHSFYSDLPSANLPPNCAHAKDKPASQISSSAITDVITT